MTAAELIAKLQEMPQDMEVGMYNGDSGGQLPVREVSIAKADELGLSPDDRFEGDRIVELRFV